MDSDGKPIINEMDGNPVDVDATSRIPEKKRDGFHHNLVRKVSRAQILVGIISIILGIVVEVLATRIVCEIYCYSFTVSLIGAGIWCGLMFIGVGILGSFAAKKKSTCLIVAMLAIGVMSILFAGTQIIISTIAAAVDRNSFKIQRNETNYHGGYHVYDSVERVIPVPLFTLNVILALLGLVMVALLITSSIVSCSATCCHFKPNYPQANLFEAVSSSGGAMYSQPMQMAPQPYVTPGGQMYYVPQGYGGNTQATMQPMVMMPMNPQAPVQYRIVGQPCPPYQGVAPSGEACPQPATANQNPTPAPVQQV